MQLTIPQQVQAARARAYARVLSAAKAPYGTLAQDLAAAESEAETAVLRAARQQERRALVIAERIAQADSYLNDVNLPSYGELVAALRSLGASGVLGRTQEHSPELDAAQRLANGLLARLGNA